MIITREQQTAEAVERMKTIKLMNNVLNDFKKGQLYRSEGYGALYYLNEEEQQRVKAFEEEHNAVVYHIIKSYTEFGDLLTYFYVSKHQEEWQYDRQDLTEGIPLCYVDNLSDPTCSEFGRIGFKSQYGGLVRTA